MNVLFVYSVYRADSFEKPKHDLSISYGVSYLSSVLKREGHRTRLLMLIRVFEESVRGMVDRFVREFRPDVMCFTAVSSEFPFIMKVARYVRSRYPEIYLAIGGTHVTVVPDESVLEVFDALCVGEGEYPLLELVAQLGGKKEPSGIQNLWIRRRDGIQKNPPRPFLCDLDVLPIPDREMWLEWVNDADPCAADMSQQLILGRGCPYDCPYCSNHILRKVAPGAYIRFRSPGNVVAEIADIHARYPNSSAIYLEVETIAANRKWAMALCDAIERFNRAQSRPLTFGANFRITAGGRYEELFAGLKRAGFAHIQMGLESGSERVRREILKRDYSNEDVLYTVKLAHRYGFRVALYNLVGIPGETPSEFNETVRMNRLCVPEGSWLQIYHPYPGTDLYRQCAEAGWLPREIGTEEERLRARIDYPRFSRKQIQSCYDWFEYRVQKGRRPVLRLLLGVLSKKLRLNPTAMSLYRRFLAAWREAESRGGGATAGHRFLRWVLARLLGSWNRRFRANVEMRSEPS